jgi:hypothetical protein
MQVPERWGWPGGTPPEDGKLMRTFLLLSVVMALTSCRATIESSEYSKACVVDADCVAVVEGDLCQACVPPTLTPERELFCRGNTTVAISASQASRYAADYAALKRGCPLDLTACPQGCVGATEAFCEAGQCAARPLNDTGR